MDHKRDTGELSPGSTDDEGDTTPAIVLNTQSNLFTFYHRCYNEQIQQTERFHGGNRCFSKVYRPDNNSFKIRLLL